MNTPALSLVRCIGRTELRVSAYSRKPTEVEAQAFEDIVRRLKLRRIHLGLTQAELNDRLGIADGLIAKWESFSRFPGAFMFACWCSALGVVLVPIGDEPPN